MLSLIVYPFMISIVTSLFIIYLSHKHDLFIDDAHSSKAQNFHTHHTSRAGGIGIFLGIIAITLYPLGLKFILPILLAFSSGIFEDFHNTLSPKLRLFLQFIAALSAVYFTNSVVIYLGFGIYLPYILGIIFSIFAIVGMMNAINIIDGFNGLASGTVLLILTSLTYVAYLEHATQIFFLSLIIISAIVGFFLLNFPKGKIFLGDGGAYMLGFIVSLIGIYLASNYSHINPWYIMAIFIYPVWEVIFSIIRRKLMGLSSLEADANHLHTLIYTKIAHNNPKTALLILLFIFPFIVISTSYPSSSIVNIMTILLFTFSYSFIYFFLHKK